MRLVLLLILTLPLQAAPVELEVGSASGRAGAELTIPVRLSRGEGIGALQFELRFDAALVELTSIDGGRALGEGIFHDKRVAPGRVWVALVSPRTFATGPLVVARVRLREDCPPGKELALSLAEARAWDSDQRDLALELRPGRLTVAGSRGLLPDETPPPKSKAEAAAEIVPARKPLDLLMDPRLLAIVAAGGFVCMALLALARRSAAPASPAPAAATPEAAPPGFCRDCGSRREGGNFCANCGARVT